MANRYLILLSLLAVFTACMERDPAPEKAPVIEDISAAPGDNYGEVVITCRVSSTWGIKSCGVCFGQEDPQTVSAENLADNTFSVRISGLSYSTTYIYYGYLESGLYPYYSRSYTWRTGDETPPVPLIRKAVPLAGPDAGTVNFSLEIPGMSDVVQKDALVCGLCYSPVNPSPTTGDFRAEAASVAENGVADIRVHDLTPGGKYYFRAYCQILQQMAYSEPLTVEIPSTAAVIFTREAESVTPTTAELHGAVSTDWLASVSACGFEWNGHTVPAAGINDDGEFSLLMERLTPQKTYSYRAYAMVGNAYYYGETLQVTTLELTYPEADYVDLGLGVCWATTNLGAETESELGDFYAWGETEPKTRFAWDNYKWCDGTGNLMTKYNDTDNLLTLTLEDDAAHFHLGTHWRMPTQEEWKNLLSQCQWIKVNTVDKKGYTVISTKEGFTDKSIFIPFEGTTGGTYWTSQLKHTNGPYIYAYTHHILSNVAPANRNEIDERFYNGLIRPVYDPKL